MVPAMVRSAPIVAILLIGGCKKPSDGELGSPSDSLAVSESTHGPGSRAGRSAVERGPTKQASAARLIAVTSTSASDARPCERVCGSLGDCLLADDAYTSTAASGLELECLDLCVHSPDGAPAKAEFLACGREHECGPLQACAEQSWAKLVAARQGPVIAAVEGPSLDGCKSGCAWLYSCSYTNAPPGERQHRMDSMLTTWIDECTHACEQLPREVEYLSALPRCLVDRCSSEGVWQCYEENNRAHGP